MDFRDTVNSAIQQLMKHEDSLATSLFKRAIEMGAPKYLVDLKAMTINYMVLPLSCDLCDYSRYGYYLGGIECYFKNLINLRNLAQKDCSFQSDYTEALRSLVNIKELFLRACGLNYQTEILKSTTGIFVEEVFTLFNIIHQIFDDVVTKDAMNIRYYLPDIDMKELTLDLLEVKAFCLNLLLSYTSIEHTHFYDKGYTATTIVNGPFADTTIKKDTGMSSSATVCPRLHIIKGKQAYYGEYKIMYEQTVSEINRYRKFDCPKALRNGICNMIEHKATNKTGKDYFKYIKKYEKEKSFWKTSDPFSWLFSLPILIYLKVFMKFSPIKPNPVCVFELDEIFTSKIFFGVCNMIANGKHWDADAVRAYFILLSMFAGVGIVAYIILAIAMKFEKYPTVFVEKHC